MSLISMKCRHCPAVRELLRRLMFVSSLGLLVAFAFFITLDYLDGVRSE